MRNYKNGLLIIMVMAMVLVTAITALRGQSQKQSQEDLKKKDDATPIQEGVMTERQRKHSKLYGSNVRGRKKLRDYQKSMDLILPPPWIKAADENAPKSTEEWLQAAACSADAVVVGTVNSKSSHLTEGGSSVFTDYELTVEEVLKGSANDQLRPAGNITVTRHGGAVALHGKTFRVLDKTQLPLDMGGKYLLFLRAIPATDAYHALDSESSFELGPDKVGRLTAHQLSYAFNYEGSPLAFVAQVHAAVSNCEKAGDVK